MRYDTYMILLFVLVFSLIGTVVFMNISEGIDNPVVKGITLFTSICFIVFIGIRVSIWIDIHDMRMNSITNSLIDCFTLDYRLKTDKNVKFAIRFKHNTFLVNFTLTTLYNNVIVDVFESGNIFKLKTLEKIKNELTGRDFEKYEAICYNKYLEKVIDKL